MMKRFLCTLCLLSAFAIVSADYIPRDYVWTSQSRNASESMPCGGHDLGMNVWVENGDVLFYIQQSGWFDENNTLLKAGRWRLHIDSQPFNGNDFEQRLSLNEGAIYIKGRGTTIRIWADVFSPNVFVQMASPSTTQATLSYESWRYKDRPVTKAECQQCSYKWLIPKDCTTFADSIKAEGNRLTFSHKNRHQTVFDFTVSYERLDAIKASLYNPIGGLEMGGTMTAEGFHFNGTTQGTYASTDYRSWNFRNEKLKEATIRISLASDAPIVLPSLSARTSKEWWHSYWQRSWIESDTPNDSLQTMLRNYELMRFMLGCNAYGQWPTKFNGGLFTFDPVFVDSAATFTPDYRKWGGGTMTAQNQRLVYWPMVKSGGFDLLSSQLDTYLRLLPNAVARTRHYWGHGGASFTEQLENYGLPNPAEYGKHKEGDDWGVEKNKWLEYEWDTALEFCLMAIQAESGLPNSREKYHELIEETLRFFDEYYQKEENLKMVIYPGSGCETYKMARNPASTIAALSAVSRSPRNPSSPREPRNPRQPNPKSSPLLDRLPNIPLRIIDGDTCIAPAESWERIQNTETPQLYPVFPWRIYGVGRPHLNIARNTYFKDPHALEMRSTKGWKQDNIWAACLGLTDEARRLNTEKLSNGPYRFPAFWDAGFDWAPDHNRGGAGMIGLQEMLLQEDENHQAILFPSWPREWNCRFRLFLSGRYIEAEIKNGVITCKEDSTDNRPVITQTRCNYQTEPTAIVDGKIRVGWQYKNNAKAVSMQDGYQIVVTERITNRSIYDSGMINSDQSQLVELPALEPNKYGYLWKVRIREEGAVSDWSQTQVIRVIPDLKPHWIGAITKKVARIPTGRWSNEVFKKDSFQTKWQAVDTLSMKSIVLRKEATLPKVITDAVVYVCGLGHYELTVNGQKVGDSEFAPLWSEYSKTVYYNVFEVTHLLKQGRNTISALLGNGFFNVQRGQRYSKLQASFGPPQLFFRMDVTYADGTTEQIISDKSWQWKLSPITFNSIYGGETYDARLETNDRWHPVVMTEGPEGRLRPETCQPVKVMEHYDIQTWKPIAPDSLELASAKTKRTIDPSAFVCDMGQNLAGFPEICVSGRQGQKVTLLVSERLTRQGACDQSQTGRQHYYEYILKGEGREQWHPRFSYYGFRYIQVEGAILEGQPNPNHLPVIHNLRSCMVYNSAAETSAFWCNNDLFNKTHRLIERAERSNMQAVLTDCPHREKLGWLEQDHLCGPSLLYNYDMTRLVPKVIRDIVDTQKPNGMVPTTAPQYVSFGNLFDDSPEWGSTLLILPFQYYDMYGDSTLITDNYEPMRRYVDYLTSRSEDGIVSHGLGDWYDYGPWKAGFSKNTPVPLVATTHYIYDLQLLTEAARMTGRSADREKYAALCQQVTDSFNRHFYKPDSCYYGSGSQTSNALPLFLGICGKNKEAVLQSLIADIHAHGDRLTTGDVGNRYLFRVLADNGYHELLFKMLNHQDTPGYGFQIAQGATTLTEQWDPRQGSSENHFMMGQIDEWLFRSLSGIRQQPGTHGMRHLIIDPQTVGDITHLRTSIRTLYGEITVTHTPEGTQYSIPGGCRTAGKITVKAGENIADALRQAREWRRTKDSRCSGGITIEIEPGRYPVSEPLYLRPEDSGTAEAPTTIIGHGAVICGKATGRRAQLGNEARQQHQQVWPKEGMLRMVDFDAKARTITIPTPPSRVRKMKHLEMVVHQRWAMAILRVKSMQVEGDKTIVTFMEPESRLEFEHPWPQPVIDGEKGNSSFLLRTTEQHDGLEQLLIVDGANHVTFEGLTFEQTCWNRPLHKGHVTLQGGFPLIDAYKLKEKEGLPWDEGLENQAWIERPVSAVTVRNARYVDFKGCRFQHLGATALDYESIDQGTVEDCHFEDIGGTAIMAGSFAEAPREVHRPYTDLADRCQNLNIQGNTIHDVANEDWGAVAIGVGYAKDCHILNNKVSRANYSGICIGWGWTPHDTGMRRNVISGNQVSDYARQLYDAGGIYTLSNQPESRISDNKISAPYKAPYATNDRAFPIYLDARTDGFTISGNTTEGRPLRREEIGDNHPGPAIRFESHQNKK